MLMVHTPDDLTLKSGTVPGSRLNHQGHEAMKRITLSFCLLAAVHIGAQSSDLASEGKAWWAHIQYLADDKLEGRNVGTPGFDKAVEYVESQFKAIGLK